jgi:hypothetical protein
MSLLCRYVSAYSLNVVKFWSVKIHAYGIRKQHRGDHMRHHLKGRKKDPKTGRFLP